MTARALWLLLLAAVGCASGAADSGGPPTDDFTDDVGGAAGAGGDAGEAGAAGKAAAGASSGGKASGGASSGGASGKGGSSGGGAAGTSGTAGKGGSSGGGAAGASGAAGKGGSSGGGAAGAGGAAGGGAGTGGTGGCKHTNANCAGPDSLGEIAGDAGTDKIVRTGTNGAAFSLLVRESSSSIIPNDLALKASLDVPVGMIYTLDVSWIPGGTCPGTPLGPTAAVAWNAKWSDAPGADDTRLLLFEVKHVSGELCADASKWTLTILGNQ